MAVSSFVAPNMSQPTHGNRRENNPCYSERNRRVIIFCYNCMMPLVLLIDGVRVYIYPEQGG